MSGASTQHRSGARASGGTGSYGTYQQKRRAQALERQKAAREDRTRVARQLLLGGAAGPDQAHHQPPFQQQLQVAGTLQAQEASSTAGMAVDEDSQQAAEAAADAAAPAHVMEPEGLSGQQLRAHYARALMQPEWMTDVPPDLSSSWLVMPRPEGQRCLVIASRGWTISRLRNGALLHRFPSHLPEGSADTRAGADAYCILDAIYSPADEPAAQQQQQQQQEANSMECAGDSLTEACGSQADGPGGCYWVLDVLAWRGLDLAGCNAEFRLYWLAAKLREDDVLGAAIGPGHRFRFAAVPVAPATPEGLAAAYHYGQQQEQQQQQQQQQQQPMQQEQPAFVQDGLYLLHREGHYCGGSTPLALLWKDAVCSRYFVDTDSNGIVQAHQQVTLQYQGDASVITSDDPSIALGRMPAAFVQQMGPKLRPGRLLRFSIQQGGMMFGPDGRPAGADLKYEGPGNERRGRADAYSKILFQYMARRQPLAFQQLLQLGATGLSTSTASGAQTAGPAAAGAAGTKLNSSSMTDLMPLTMQLDS